MADWSELHYDLLVLIGKRLNLIEDYLNFASVCKPWRRVATKENFNTSLPRAPWLMLADEEGNSCRQFFSLYNGMILNKRIPKSSGKRCMETMGWLVTVGKDEGEINLLQPFSGVQIALPHQSTTEKYDTHYQTGYLWNFFRKAVLSASPSQTTDYVLMVIGGGNSFLSFWRPGDLRWTVIERQPFYGALCDVTCFNGKFYAIAHPGVVLVCDIAGPDPIQTQIVARLPNEYAWDQLYIVESLGSLFIVERDGGMSRYITDDSERIPLTHNPEIVFYHKDDDEDEVSDDDEDEVSKEITYGTYDIRVFELDLVAGKLTQTKELGDRALFIGHNASRSVQPSQFPGIKPNHIYFTDDYDESYLQFEEGGGLDMGVFNIADGTIVPLPRYKGVSLSRVCPPTWVTPTLY